MNVLEKKKRIINKKLLKQIRESERCLVCNISQPDPHHITSVGAGGGDTEDNLMPLCRIHHTKIHALGIKRMCESHPVILRWIENHERLDLLGKMNKTKLPLEMVSILGSVLLKCLREAFKNI